MEHESPVRYIGGLGARLVWLRMLASYAKYAARRRRYPLFILNPSKGGLLKTLQTAKDVRLQKFVKSNGGYRFCLSIPRWPSSAHDQMAARGGLNVRAAGTKYKQQVDQAFLAVSRKCAYHCRHCYERHNTAAVETVPLAAWQRTAKDLQDLGANVIVLTGGEPMLRFDDVLELVKAGDKSRSEFHIHTSGHGVTEARASALKRAGLEAAAIGLDDVNPARHDTLRGYPGAFSEAVQAIHAFRRAGVFTYINLCLTKDLVRSGDLPALMELAKGLGLGAVRFLDPVPVGGYLGEDVSALFSDDDRKTATEFFEEVNGGRRYRRYPFISYEAYAEAPERLGCQMGGLSLFAVDSLGNVLPCVFLPVSFGNILDEDLPSIYARMRRAVPGPCRQGCSAALLADAIKDQVNRGMPLPLPFESMRLEWQRLYPDSQALTEPLNLDT
jgi:MoaA/NifB/PqqE/SkfB family radical SAM enzyme